MLYSMQNTKVPNSISLSIIFPHEQINGERRNGFLRKF